MTREEVVKWLESLKREIGKAENRTLWHYAESIDMAIEALKAKTDDDLISRKAVKAKANKFFEHSVIFESQIDALPSAEPKTGAKIVPKEESDMYIAGYRDGHDDATKTARWIQKDLCADRFCSNCDYVVWDSEAEEYNFCPNCGANMR